MTSEQKEYIESDIFVEGFRCLELEIPWIVGGAIYWLDKELNNDDVVLEVGTGGSSIFFGKRCKSIHCIETNINWALKVSKELESVWAAVEYRHIPNEDDICKHIMDSNLDDVTVVLVDTQGGYNRSRILNAIMYYAPSLRMIILDNFQHKELFPEHFDKILTIAPGWIPIIYNHPRWAGNGTIIYFKTKGAEL